jgi:aryl-phospho-beta-D-glucosidase BglC (GH1 family)
MKRKLAFTALALTVVLGSAGTALAARHKNPDPVAPTDPRIAYKWQGSNHGTWCDNSADCNGWSKWLTEVDQGKLKIAPDIR